MRAAIYARVSTNKQDELLQVPRLQEYAERIGAEVVKVYTDEASGRDSNRPGWQSLLKDSRAGLFDTVLVTKLDRLMRSLVQLLAVLEDFKKRRISILSLDFGALDPSSATGQMQVQLLAILAEWERGIISERTREALQVRRSQGVKLGRPSTKLPIHTIALMRLQGDSWAKIGRALHVSQTPMKTQRYLIEAEMDAILLGRK